MAPAPTLLFCVGATKAGTSWLQDYLSFHPDCHLKAVKELHYFDHHALGAGWALAEVKRRIQHRKAALAAGTSGDPLALAAELADLKALKGLMQAAPDDRAYLRFLTEGRGERRLVADVTPAYSLLSVERLGQMARLLPDVRFLYVMRDPLARLWSHVRMIARRRAAPPQRAEVADRVLAAVIAGGEPAISVRSDYAGAIARLRAAVDPSRLMLAFYEELLTVPGIATLCAFLGIADRPGDLARRVHAGDGLALAPGAAQAARAWLRSQYDDVERVMGRLPDAWRRAPTEVLG